MATAAERMRRHRDRRRRGVAVVAIEVDQDMLELICDLAAVDLDAFADGDYGRIPKDVLNSAAQEFFDSAVAYIDDGCP